MTGSPIYFTKWKQPSYRNLHYHMSIKKSQAIRAILKCVIHLKSSAWFTLGSEDETMFYDTWYFFQLDCQSRFSKHLMTGSPIFSVNLTNRKNPVKPNYHMSIKESQAKFTENIGLRSFIIFNTLTGSRTEKSSRCHKTWFRLLSPA